MPRKKPPSTADPQWIAETAARFKALYSAIVYDVMDESGLPNQCLDLGIRPLDREMQVAGPAYTILVGPDIREQAEVPNHPKLDDWGLFTRMPAGCVIVIQAAGTKHVGVWGELLSNTSRVNGATGVVVDGNIRDGRLLRDIDDFAVFARDTSPVESARRSRIHDLDIPISLTGTLTSQVRVNPGDWIYGDEDGTLVIPADKVEEILLKAEEAKVVEDNVRAEIRAGVFIGDVFAKHGRL